MGSHGIAPTQNCTHILKNVINLIYSIGGYNRNKTRPGDHESYLKKVGAIPCEPDTGYFIKKYAKHRKLKILCLV